MSYQIRPFLWVRVEGDCECLPGEEVCEHGLLKLPGQYPVKVEDAE